MTMKRRRAGEERGGRQGIGGLSLKAWRGRKKKRKERKKKKKRMNQMMILMKNLMMTTIIILKILLLLQATPQEKNGQKLWGEGEQCRREQLVILEKR